jgi:hypothetical protein
VILDLRREPLEHLREVLEAASGTSDSIEPLLGRLAGRILFERASQCHERCVQVASRILVELCNLVKQLDPSLGRLRAADLDLVNADELRVVAEVSIERLQQIRDRELVPCILAEAFECAEGLRVADVAFEYLPIPLDGDVDLPNLLLAQRGKAEHEPQLSLIRRRERKLRLEILR